MTKGSRECTCSPGYTGSFCETGKSIENVENFTFFSFCSEYFQCLSNGRFTDRYNCRQGKYFECVHNQLNQRGLVLSRICPSYLRFNVLVDRCDYPENVSCPDLFQNKKTILFFFFVVVYLLVQMIRKKISCASKRREEDLRRSIFFLFQIYLIKSKLSSIISLTMSYTTVGFVFRSFVRLIFIIIVLNPQSNSTARAAAGDTGKNLQAELKRNGPYILAGLGVSGGLLLLANKNIPSISVPILSSAADRVACKFEE